MKSILSKSDQPQALPMITDPFFYYAAVPAIIITGIAKGGFCSPLSMLSVPVIALIIDPVQAAAIMLPILVCMDMVGLIAYRGKANWRVLAQMLPFAVCGVALGWFFADKVDENVTRLALGLTAIGFVLNYALNTKRQQKARSTGLLSASLWGTIAGFTSFIAHAGNPPYQMHTLPLRMPPILFAATTVHFFAILNLIKLVPYFALGQFSRENLLTTLSLLPLAPLAIGVGVFLVRKISQELFYRLAYGAMLMVALKLCFDGVSTLF